MTDAQLVSIVTPVYNGGRFLRECIESALSQTHGDFEYIILDNASTDDTRAIVQEFAARDGRIRVFRNDHTLPPIENWNRAVALISGSSEFFKILHADDVIYPQCLGKMIEAAKIDPSIGIVGALRLRGDRIECEGLPTDRMAFGGSAVARLFLRQEIFALAPTSGLVRSALVRARRPFYRPDLLHADIAAYLDMLDRTNFAFVHEVLTFSREHAGSITATIAERKQTLLREWLTLLDDYGPRYFSADELHVLQRRHLLRCHRLLVRTFAMRRDRPFIEFQMAGLREAGRLPGTVDFMVAAAAEVVAALRHPQKVVRQLHRHFPSSPR